MASAAGLYFRFLAVGWVPKEAKPICEVRSAASMADTRMGGGGGRKW